MAFLLFVALCCSVIAFLVYNFGMVRLRASDAAMTIYVTPLAGVTLAVILPGETLTASGTALIVAGLYATQAGARRDEEGRCGPADAGTRDG